ncbi:MAG: alpha-amylase family glycosyl hydrolase [Chloroflexota bacterium]
MSRSAILIRRVLALAAVFLVAVLAVPAFTAGAAAHDNNVQWTELGHNSRDPLFRDPGGAVPTGTAVRLRLRAADGDLTAAKVRVWNDRIDQQTIYNMVKVASGVTFTGDANVYEFWEATLPPSADPTIYYYRFIAEDGSSTAYYEDDNARTGGWGQTFGSSPDNSWQLTIYDPAFETPEWVKNAVIYQIFADRFRDGDVSNDNAAGEFFYGAFDTIVRSNTTDWNARICDPRAAAGSTATCAGKYSNNFYGGDLQGIIDELDYIQDLGVTALYLNPIFESPSNHKYDTKDFLQIDDNFGDLALFQTLVAQANSRGIKIILDGVFNHTSSDSRYFDRYSRWDANGDPTTLGVNDGSGACEATASPYASWYHFMAAVGAPPCSDNRDYESWFGYDSLPKLQSGNAAVRDYFIGAGSGATTAVGPYWIDQGAAGWRLDVGGDVDPGQINDPSNTYWDMFREAVKSVDPDAYIVGEEWGNATSWTVGDEWDATMNYQFAAAVLSFWRDETFTDNDFNSGSSAGPLNPLDANGVAERLLNLQERYAPEAFAAMLNLFNSHDTNRVLFLLDHNTDTNDTGDYNNPAYDWSDSITRYKGALIMQMTLPGAPTIYYGDEVGTVNPPAWDGSQWQDDPYNRVPYPWLDETGTPYYVHMQSQVAQDALSGYVSDLTSIRNSHAALRTGSFDVFDTGNSDVFAYGRKTVAGDEIAIVLVNKSGTEQTVTLDLDGYVPETYALDDLLSAASYGISGGSLTVPVPAMSGRILLVTGNYATPDAINDLTATPNGATVIDLDWSAPAGATWYEIYRSRLSGGGYEYVTNTLGNTQFTDTGLETGETYYYVVVARADDGLASGWSNEASATTSYTIGWANLQWPPTLNHTASATLLTDTIYSWVWIDGVTSQPGAPPGLLAEVGYGDSTNTSDGSWQWFAMTFNEDKGNNDEYMGNLPRTEVGTFCYTTRYSGNGGNTWFYAVNGPDEGNVTCPGPFGVLTITTGGDITAPDTPTNLTVTGVSSVSIGLGWDVHPDTGGDLYAFRVYRGPVGGPYNQIAQIINPAATSYVDTGVTAGQTYEYYVTAVDTSVNESGASNIVEATAENLLVDVTFQVTVPSFTPGTVYLVGGFGAAGYPDWDPGAPSMAMTETSPNVWEITLQILDGTMLEYKYTRGSWDVVEKQADGFTEVSNRGLTVNYGTTGEQLVEDTIANWRDRIVTGHTPADGATGVDPSAVVTVSWNKSMANPPAGTFTVTGPGGAVSGVFTWDEGSKTHTFTPDAPLAPGLYTVEVAGNNSGGDTQFVPVTFSFTVPGEEPETQIFVTATGGRTDDGVTYKKNDILLWDGDSWSKWFEGAAHGLTNRHDINAIAVPDGSTGEVYLSFAANRVQLPGISDWVMGQDVVYYDGASYSLYLDGSDLGLTTVSEKIDSLEVVATDDPQCEAYVLLSLQGNGRVNGLGNVRGEDILALCLQQSGADTQYEWLTIIRGADEGMKPNTTIALSWSGVDSSPLYFLTRSTFNVDGVVGGHSTVYSFDLPAETFDGPHWRAADHGLHQKVDSLDINGSLTDH